MQVLISEPEFDLDLFEFKCEGLMNGYFSKKFPHRIRCKWADEEHKVLRLELRGYVLAVFTTFDESLYRCSALDLHWILIKSSFKQMYDKLKCYE